MIIFYVLVTTFILRLTYGYYINAKKDRSPTSNTAKEELASETTDTEAICIENKSSEPTVIEKIVLRPVEKPAPIGKNKWLNPTDELGKMLEGVDWNEKINQKKQAHLSNDVTIQVRETLMYDGLKYGIREEPLEQYLSKLKERPVLDSGKTLCWRGYYGTWQLKDNKLYLVELIAYGPNYLDYSIDYIFPGESVVFADWYSDTIVIPYFDILNDEKQEMSSVKEKQMLLEIKNGVLVKTTIQERPPREDSGIGWGDFDDPPSPIGFL